MLFLVFYFLTSNPLNIQLNRTASDQHSPFTFNHLVTFIQSNLQMRRAIEAIKVTMGQQYASAVTISNLSKNFF